MNFSSVFEVKSRLHLSTRAVWMALKISADEVLAWDRSAGFIKVAALNQIT
jgi:hypothetical protein